MSLVLSLLLLMQSPLTLRITDPWGLPVPGAEVKVASTGYLTGDNGEIALPANLPGDFEIEVLSEGFEPVKKTFSRWTGTQEIQLKLASVFSGVTVTATRTERPVPFGRLQTPRTI